MLIHKEVNTSITVSAGSWSDNTHYIQSGILKQIIVQANTDTTTFDFALIDEDSITQSWLRNTDELVKEVEIPVRGKYTMQISNSSVLNETYKVKLLIDESS